MSEVLFTKEQKQAIQSQSAKILCLASPGAGKTMVLCERIRYLITSGTAPAEIVVLTFTNAAAREIQKRIGDVKLSYTGTLHGFMLRLCTAHASAIGYGGKISVVDADQAEDFLIAVVAKLKLKATKGEIETAIALGPRALCNGTPASLIASDYFRTMRKNGLMDFDMVLHYGLEVAGYTGWMKTEPKHLLVDEAQDSAEIDFQIYASLPIPNKFLVGDCDQRIFSFRGSSDAFEKMCNSALQVSKP